MAQFFIRRPIFAIVLSLIITLLGMISAFNLPVAQYPQIAPPTISVNTFYPGANADVVNQTVAQAIEEKLNGVEGMVSMSSTSSDSGSYSLSIQFESGKDADTAAVQSQNRVSEANASLPSAVQSTGVTTRKSSHDMALVFTFWSPNNTYDATFLKNYGTIYLLNDVKQVKGVGDVFEFGADYSMRIWLDPEKMKGVGVTTSDVTAAIEKHNVQAPVGTFGKMPSAAGQQFQYSARVQGRLTDTKEFEDIIVRFNAQGGAVRIRDIARVELGRKDYIYEAMLGDGHASAGFAIQLTSDANALETIDNVKKVIAEAAKNFPDDLQYKIVVDNSKFVRQSIIEVVKTLVEAMLLVLLVVFVFLQSWRATLIPMLAVPVSLIGTFGAFVVLGFSINTLTLFAMVLAIGLVVDDAIIVIESVEHHMRYSGLSPLAATEKALSEVSGPVIAIAFVLASVFIPVAFFGGMMGILYKQFALTIAVSMALSAIVALSLTPALCTLLLKPYNPNAHKGLISRFFAWFNQAFASGIERYGKGLKTIIPKARLCLVFLAVLLIMTGLLYRLVPSSFVPNEDQGYYIVSLSLPEAASLNRTSAALNELGEKINAQPGVDSSMAVAGFDLLGGGTKPNAGALFVALAPWSERNIPPMQLNAEIGQTFMNGAKLTKGNVIAFAPPSLPGLGIVGGFSFVIEDRSGGSTQKLDEVIQKFVEAAQKRPEIRSVAANFHTDTPGYQFEIDRDKVDKLGLSMNDVFVALQSFLGGTEVNDFNKFGRTYKVIVQADAHYRRDAGDLRYFYVKSSNNTMVPLSTLIKPKTITAPPVITRYNGVTAVIINGSQAPGFSSGQAMAALEEVAAQTLPSGYTYEWSGQSREEKLSGNRAPIVFGLAIIFVFLCLAALYESWSIPFAVLLAIPIGMFGAFLFQYMRNLENSIYMQIGLVMLIGLAAKNAILIVEFAKVRVDNGMSPVQAAIEAAKIRLRPILMTSLAFIIGCIPLAIATGAGSGARNSMGTAVVGGMLTTTLIGIFIIPVLFVTIETLANKLRKNTRKAESTDVS